VCGEGIYATRPREDAYWREGESIRFTRTKDNRTVYCFALNWPGKSLVLRSVKPKPGSEIRMFGYPEPVKWKFDRAAGLAIEIPEALQSEDRRPTPYAWGWKIPVAE